MNKSLTTLLLLAVSCASALAQAQGATGAPSSQSMQGKVAMCIGCHGIPGYRASFPEVHRVPMISGQSAGYIAAALKSYRKGDRKHPSMRGVADSLSDQDINDIAAYYESHGTQTRKTVADRPSREPGPEVAALLQKAACASCHGANFSKPIDPSYPKIAGQHADYMFVALKAYKEGNSQTVGRNNAVMGAIAKQFSNAELKALSEYVSSLDGELLVKPESRFR